MNNEIKQLFEQVAQLTGYKTTSEINDREKDPKADYYKNEFLILENVPIYGGYKISIVHTSTGQSGFDGENRRNKKEMVSYLRGLIKGLSFNK